MSAEIHKLPEAATRLHCSQCGVTVEAACKCGVGYISAVEAAAVAVEKNPEKSDRAIAAEIGVSAPTVGKARKATTEKNFTVEKRTGRDGKKRRQPKARHASEAAKRAAAMVLDQGTTHEKAAAETGLGSELMGRMAVAREEGRREVLADPIIDPATLPKSAQEKLAAAVRQHKRDVERNNAQVIEQGILDGIRDRTERLVLPSYKESRALYERVIKARNGALTEGEFKVLLRCLHPDTRASASVELLRQGYDIILSKRLELVPEKENPTRVFTVPSIDEFMTGRRRR